MEIYFCRNFWLNMAENQDYLRRSTTTQTDVDPLYQNALRIVNSFEII